MERPEFGSVLRILNSIVRFILLHLALSRGWRPWKVVFTRIIGRPWKVAPTRLFWFWSLSQISSDDGNDEVFPFNFFLHNFLLNPPHPSLSPKGEGERGMK